MSGIVDQTTMDEREAEVQQRVKASESNEWWLQTLCVPKSEREREDSTGTSSLWTVLNDRERERETDGVKKGKSSHPLAVGDFA
jgi:hypothetical protein